MTFLKNSILVASGIFFSFSHAMPKVTPPPVSLPSPISPPPVSLPSPISPPPVSLPSPICTDGPINALPHPPIGLPGSCLAAGGVKGPGCFTHTVQIPSKTCPHILCASPSPDQVCPLYIKISSTTVPCATNCCPATPTATYACGPCPTCDPCRIPTIWTTFTTGCPGGGTQSSVTTITPPPYHA